MYRYLSPWPVGIDSITQNLGVVFCDATGQCFGSVIRFIQILTQQKILIQIRIQSFLHSARKKIYNYSIVFFGYMEKNNGIRYRYLILMTNLWKFLTFWNALQVPVPGSGSVFGLRIRIQKAIEYGFITGIRIWNTEWVKIFSLLNKNLLKIVFTFWTKRSCWSHQNYRTRSRSIVGGFTT